MRVFVFLIIFTVGGASVGGGKTLKNDILNIYNFKKMALLKFKTLTN